MATSSLSSLGLGSSGTLSYDTIDKLRAVDESAILTPTDNKITTNTTKQTDLTTLTKLVTTLQSSTSALANENNYLKRTTTSSNSAVSVTAASGTSVQDITMHVNTLAKQDIYQSKSFSSDTSTFATGNDTLRLSVNGTDYSINVTTSTTLADLKNMINDVAGEKVTASILNVGGTDPYRLIIKSDSMGSSNAITLSATGSTVTDLGLNNLQPASDASFTYNGVTISRSTNTISDLVTGMTFTLNETQASGTNSTIAVAQDWTDVKKNLTSLATAYNDLIANLKTSTGYNSTTKTSGTFQGVSQITSLSTNIRQQIFKVDSNERSLANYGLSFNESTGLLEFNATTFTSKTTSNADDVKDFFVGSTNYSTVSYTGSTISADALSVGTSDFLINGTPVSFTTSAGATVSDNLAALKAAISNAGVTGIEASLGDNNNIVLKSTIAGSDISISGTTSILASLGLQATNVYSESTVNKGIFTSFDTVLKSYTDSTSGSLTQFKTSLTTEKTALTKRRAADVTSLDKKYEAMATKFAAYDSIISKLNNQFSSLSSIIKQSYVSK